MIDQCRLPGAAGSHGFPKKQYAIVKPYTVSSNKEWQLKIKARMKTPKTTPSLTGQTAWTVVSLAIIVPIGFYSKFYTGPSANWVNNSLGGVFYEIFWCLLIYLFFSNSKPWVITSLVLLATCLMEFLQLWHPSLLQWIRSYFIGRTVLGTTFSWDDFPYYFLGCAIGWLWMRILQSLAGRT